MSFSHAFSSPACVVALVYFLKSKHDGVSSACIFLTTYTTQSSSETTPGHPIMFIPPHHLGTAVVWSDKINIYRRDVERNESAFA